MVPGASAAEGSPEGWTSRLIVTYAPNQQVNLPAGVRLVRRSASAAVVALSRRAVFSDLRRFTDPSIISVEPDLRITRAVTPNDPSFPAQWDMSDAAAGPADYSVKAPGAWAITTGSSDLTVAVIDTGLVAHSEFAGRTVAGYDFVSDTGISNDGDARDGDASDPGDWVTEEESESGYFEGCAPGPSSWHGTHVAGTIAATGNNGQGIAGLNWSSKLQPIRALGKCFGYTSDIADAIRWAAGGTVPGVPANATPARIINLSLGGGGSCASGSYMQSAINDARSRGAIVVVAAGNENQNTLYSNPANCAGVVAVAATDRDGYRAYYSNYGSLVDIAAPGGDLYVDSLILSTLNSGTEGPAAESYEAYQGTSMAAPHVAGVLSLLLSYDQYITESEALTLMTNNLTPFPSGGGQWSCTAPYSCGAGIINATAMLEAAVAMPDGQGISFPEQSNRFMGEGPFAPGATTSSALAVTYAASPANVCTSNGTLITLTGRGTCVVTASQAGGSGFRAAAPVARSVNILAAATPVVSVDVSFPSAPVVGTLYSPNLGAWNGGPAPTVTHQWFSCTRSGSATTSTRTPSGCSQIAGAASATFTPLPAHAGRFLRLAETATNLAGRTTRYSATSPAVQSAPVNTATPIVSGTPRAGRTVTARVGRFSGTTPIAYSYQWYACLTRTSASPSLPAGCTEISGAVNSSFALSNAQVGRYMVVRVVATNLHGSATFFSTASIVVR